MISVTFFYREIVTRHLTLARKQVIFVWDETIKIITLLKKKFFLWFQVIYLKIHYLRPSRCFIDDFR